MQPLRSFALRNYLTLIFCAATLVAFLGAGMSSVSGSKGVPVSTPESESKRTLNPVPAASPLFPSPEASRDLRSDALKLPLRPASVASPFAASLTATKTDNISTPVNPGDTIMYTVTINNTGTVDLTNVNFTDTVDTNTTLDAASIKVAPIAVKTTTTLSATLISQFLRRRDCLQMTSTRTAAARCRSPAIPLRQTERSASTIQTAASPILRTLVLREGTTLSLTL